MIRVVVGGRERFSGSGGRGESGSAVVVGECLHSVVSVANCESYTLALFQAGFVACNMIFRVGGYHCHCSSIVLPLP